MATKQEGKRVAEREEALRRSRWLCLGEAGKAEAARPQRHGDGGGGEVNRDERKGKTTELLLVATKRGGGAPGS